MNTIAQLLASTMVLTTPILLAAMGGLVNRKGGIVNIALEGKMLVGAFVAVLASATTGSWLLAALAAAFAGAIVGYCILARDHEGKCQHDHCRAWSQCPARRPYRIDPQCRLRRQRHLAASRYGAAAQGPPAVSRGRAARRRDAGRPRSIDRFRPGRRWQHFRSFSQIPVLACAYALPAMPPRWRGRLA